MAEKLKRTGTQSIERAVAILKALSLRGSLGWRLVDLANHCSMDRGTTHRILSSLSRERLVRQRVGDRRYVLGTLLFELGLSQSELIEFLALCNNPLSRISKRFNGMTMLFLLSGNEFVCALKLGQMTIKALTIEVGTRRPLIVSAGGVAMLVAMPKPLSELILKENLKDVSRFSDTRITALKKMLKRSEDKGYGISLSDVVPGVSAFGIAIKNDSGHPFASICFVCPESHLSSSVTVDLVAAIESESRWIAREANKIRSIHNVF